VCALACERLEILGDALHLLRRDLAEHLVGDGVDDLDAQALRVWVDREARVRGRERRVVRVLVGAELLLDRLVALVCPVGLVVRAWQRQRRLCCRRTDSIRTWSIGPIRR
jgi:hypothetical protein